MTIETIGRICGLVLACIPVIACYLVVRSVVVIAHNSSKQAKRTTYNHRSRH